MTEYEIEKTDFSDIEKLQFSYSSYYKKQIKEMNIGFSFIVSSFLLLTVATLTFMDIPIEDKLFKGLGISLFGIISIAMLFDCSDEGKKILLLVNKKINPFYKDISNLNKESYFASNEVRLSILEDIDYTIKQASHYDFLIDDVKFLQSTKAEYLLLEDTNKKLWKESCSVIETIINIKDKIKSLENNHLYRQYETKNSKPLKQKGLL